MRLTLGQKNNQNILFVIRVVIHKMSYGNLTINLVVVMLPNVCRGIGQLFLMLTKNDFIQGASQLGQNDVIRGTLTALAWHPTKKINKAELIRFRPGKQFPKIFLHREKSRNNPTQSPVMVAVHSITTKRTTKLQTRRHYCRLFNSLFNGRNTTLQTFIQWHQASAVQSPL